MVNQCGSRHGFTGDEYLPYIKQKSYVLNSFSLKMRNNRIVKKSRKLKLAIVSANLLSGNCIKYGKHYLAVNNAYITKDTDYYRQVWLNKEPEEALLQQSHFGAFSTQLGVYSVQKVLQKYRHLV